MKSAHVAIDHAALAAIEAHAEEFRRLGVASLGIYGSRARRDAKPDSDLDVLVACENGRKFSLYDLVEVERLLERVTGLDVHVATRDAFRPERLDRVLRDVINVI